MAQISSDKSTWLRFFKDASVPAEFVSVYATKFVENRIRFDMLGDLDRALLNEMGIAAIGDCLSILKHAKIIMQKLSEHEGAEKAAQTTHQASSNSSQQDLSQRRRGEVAKRIIETYLCDPDAKPLTEKGPLIVKSSSSPAAAQSMLSPELISRLNFNPSSGTVSAVSATATQYPKISVTFNDDPSIGSAKVIVSSTTDDNDGSAAAASKKLLSLKKKRSISEVYESQLPPSKRIAAGAKKSAGQVGGPPLEYRGLLKQTSASTSNVISLKSPKTATNPALRANKPVQSRLSLTSASSKESDHAIQGQISANLENIRIQVRNDTMKATTNKRSGSNLAATAVAKESVFSRLNLSRKSPADSTSSPSPSKPLSSDSAATVRLLNNFGIKTKDSPNQQSKMISLSGKKPASDSASKPAIKPITFSPDDFKPKSVTSEKAKPATAAGTVVKPTSNLFSRLSR